MNPEGRGACSVNVICFKPKSSALKMYASNRSLDPCGQKGVCKWLSLFKEIPPKYNFCIQFYAKYSFFWSKINANMVS